MSQVVPLTPATRDDLPPPCVSCLFWQHPVLVSDERRKGAWASSHARRHGAFGRVLSDGRGVRGMVQYGPAHAFPRALMLPAGPPDRLAGLLTCTYLQGGDPAGTCERLVLEALADLKARGLPAVEAFGLGYPDEVPLEDRFLGHHTLFDRGFLEGLGFAPSRTRGQVSLMRLPLGGLAPAGGLLERLAGALRAEPSAPAAPA